MDTSTVAASPPPLAALRDSGRALAAGLAWGGGMLLILAAWLAVKEGGAGTLSYSIGVVGVAALACALWSVATLWQKLPAEAETARLTHQRRSLGLALLAAGALLLVLALVLGLTRKADATLGFTFALDQVGTAGGLLLFSLISLGTGFRLQAPPAPDVNKPVDTLRHRLPFIKLALTVFGIVLLGCFAYLAFYKQIGSDAFPELVCLLLLSALCFGMIIWLGFTPSQQLETTYLRAGILFFGGVAGLVLFLTTLGRAWLWRQDLFLGGLSAWQGDNAWRLWLVAYVQLVALGLVFGSFSLSRTDVRNNPTMRRALYGYNTFFQCLLVLEMLMVMVVAVYAMAPFTFQWSKAQGMYALSGASQNLLSGLKKEVHVFVLMSPGGTTYHDLHNLLDNAQMQTSKVNVQYISPDRDAVEYDRLAKLFPKILPDVKLARSEESGRGVLLVYGAMPKSDQHDVKYAFIAERKLTDQKMDQGHRPTRMFTGEGEVMRELSFLAQGQVKRKVYVLQGAGLPDLSETLPSGRRYVTMGFNQVGIGLLADKLRKENYEVQGLSFELALPAKKAENLTYAKETGADKKKDVPEDADALLIAGAASPLSTEVVDAVTRYADRGGRLMVFVDVVTDDNFSELKSTGLEPLLKRYGVEVESAFALRIPPDPRMLGRIDLAVLHASAPLKATNPIAKQFWRDRFAIVMRNSARLLKAGPGGQFKIEPLLQFDKDVSEELFLSDSNPADLRDPTRFEIDLFNDRTIATRVAMEPLTVAVAVSETQNEKPRLIVFGDTDFITNFDVARSPRDQNFAMVLSGLEWMAKREEGFIGPRPKETTMYALPVLPTESLSRMVNVPGWLMLLTLLGLGTGIWLVRRR